MPATQASDTKLIARDTRHRRAPQVRKPYLPGHGPSEAEILHQEALFDCVEKLHKLLSAGLDRGRGVAKSASSQYSFDVGGDSVQVSLTLKASKDR